MSPSPPTRDSTAALTPVSVASDTRMIDAALAAATTLLAITHAAGELAGPATLRVVVGVLAPAVKELQLDTPELL